ncbi:hypothetical protein [Rhodococcus globerulus]|uniref:Uncharacterized protein n=1 Tax=Rhodococcus globerulus TaxID=33008 RepID=A0ABU4C5L4_RHOGO|nr:hypothetical protein [Rhodococcus globerulus]MDV6271710.1 hypothetical protein [Rhodococcus globerulus]
MALPSTALAAFSAAPEGALDSFLVDAGFAAPEVRRSVNGLSVPSSEVVLWAMLIDCPGGSSSGTMAGFDGAFVSLQSNDEKSMVEHMSQLTDAISALGDARVHALRKQA